MTKDEVAQIVQEMPDGMDVDDYLVELVNRAIAIEREACAAIADIALLGAERSLSERVVRAILARGEK